MEKDNEYPYKHKHVAIAHGHATFYGEGEPSKELLEALNKMAELAYEQCGGVKVDTGANNALLPDVVNCATSTDEYIKSMNVVPRSKLHEKYDL